MYEIIKNVIETGVFKVNDFTNKIDTLWAESKLSDEERTELLSLMKDHLNPNTEAPELKELYIRLEERVTVIEEEVKKLKEEEPIEPEDPVTIPSWKPWDGISKDYVQGAVVEHNGKYYLNVYEGVQNTWEPGTPGVDDRIWKSITKEEAEEILRIKEPDEPLTA